MRTKIALLALTLSVVTSAPALARNTVAAQAGDPPVAVVARLIAEREALALSPTQLRALHELHAKLDQEHALQRLSSKPQNTAPRFTSAAEARRQALAVLSAEQRGRAERVLEALQESGTR